VLANKALVGRLPVYSEIEETPFTEPNKSRFGMVLKQNIGQSVINDYTTARIHVS
jgi:hypothetical protein